MYLPPKNYVDDVRQGTEQIRKGCRFDKDENAIVFKEERKQSDKEENLTDLRRMGNVCLEAMNSVAEDLTFAVESQEEFENTRLQTLDFEAWLDEDEGIVKHNANPTGDTGEERHGQPAEALHPGQ